MLKFETADIEQIITKMIKDVKLLEMYGLMDYSLLFVISYNPKYVSDNEHLFVADESGELVKPLKLKDEKKFASPMVMYN